MSTTIFQLVNRNKSNIFWFLMSIGSPILLLWYTWGIDTILVGILRLAMVTLIVLSADFFFRLGGFSRDR